VKRIVITLAAVAALLIGGASPAAAATGTWQGNGYPSATCTASTQGVAQWVWTGDAPTALIVNGQAQSGSWVQSGGGSWKFFMTINAQNWPPTSASITYTGDAGTLTISGCNEQSTPPPTPTPTPVPTPTPTPVPTPTPTPVPTPTPTPVPTPTPTPIVTPTPTPTVVIDQFAVEPAVCRLDDAQSRIRIRLLAGIILLTNLDFRVDGNVITAADIEFNAAGTEAFIPVTPGVHTVDIVNGETVLAEVTVDCPTCFNAPPPPPPTCAPDDADCIPPTATPTHKATLPPTDTLSTPTDGTTGGGITPLFLILGAVAAGSLFLTRKRR
jgi:hypothetical protein